MTDVKMYAWLFLCVSTEPTSLAKIILTADGIDRSYPRLNELQTTLGWLQAQGLVKKESKEYLYTQMGVELYQSIPKGNIFEIWDAIANKFSLLPEMEFEPDEITEKELITAHKLSKRYFK